jgi:hypothetical protein
MNGHLLLITTSLGFLSLGSQAFSCGSTQFPNALSSPTSSPAQPAPNIDIETDVDAEDIFQPVDLPPLPPLSAAEVGALQTELTHGIDTWFGLAGLNKVSNPPPLMTELQEYRSEWSRVDPRAATFLGSWHDSEGYAYSINIFPSRTLGEVCVLEFRPEWSLDIFNEITGEYGKDMISEQILTFSVATVDDEQLRSSQVRSVGSAIALENYAGGESYPVLFMSVMDDQDIRRVVALASPPTLPSEFPEVLIEPVLQTLDTYGCITDRAPSGE